MSGVSGRGVTWQDKRCMDSVVRTHADGSFERVVPPVAPITARSVVLFRLGEACNNACPFCSNSGRPGARLIAPAETLRRVERLVALGVRRVVVTGGEPTIHPAFDDVVMRLNARGIRWDLNTHGRRFADQGFTERTVQQGLRRAIVSLHHHRAEISARLFGAAEVAHRETLAGIERLLRAGVQVMLNCVLTRDNLDALSDLVDECLGRFAGVAPFAMKFAFPSTSGKGGAWDGIQLRFEDVRSAVAELERRRADWPMPIYFEGLPNCVVGRGDLQPMTRTGFGETHYLEDLDGQALFAMEHVEAQSCVFAPACASCVALPRCQGVAKAYAARYGLDELSPFDDGAA